MTESVSQPIHYPGEQVHPQPTAPDPNLEALDEAGSAEIEQAVYGGASDGQDQDIILSSTEQHVLSDRAQRVLTSLNERARIGDVQRQISDGNPRNLSTNRAAMVRQFGSLTLFRSRIRKSKS